MARIEIKNEGAFDREIRKQINDNFEELYGTQAGGTLADGKILVGNVSDEAAAVDVSGDAEIDNTGAVTVTGVNGEPVTLDGAELDLAVLGHAAGYAVARGEHQQAAASDTVATGLSTVVAVVISPRTRTVKQLWFNASVGDQAGTPDAGSFLLTSQKPTAVDNCTPTDATDFTDNIKVNWIAIGTP